MTDPIKIMDEIARDNNPLSTGNGDYLAVEISEWRSLRTAIERQAEELAQARARIARLELTLRHTADGVHSLDEARAFARKALNESPRQSHAAVKAEALRDYARKIANADKFGHAEDLFREAERIEREAKEES